MEEAEGLLGRRGGEADQGGVEVFEHLAPEVVDGAVAFVGDDEVEGLDGESGVVDGFHRRLARIAARKERGVVFVAGLVFGVAAEHGEEALDGGDADLRNRIELVGLHVLDVVQLSEEASVVRGAEALELVEGLASEVVAVDQEEDAAGVGVLDKAVGEVAGGDRSCPSRWPSG